MKGRGSRVGRPGTCPEGDGREVYVWGYNPRLIPPEVVSKIRSMVDGLALEGNREEHAKKRARKARHR